MNEFKQHGLTVPTSKPMQFSEVGIGGRRVIRGTADPDKAVQTPWEGTANPRSNPWKQPPMQKLRRQYHDALIHFWPSSRHLGGNRGVLLEHGIVGSAWAMGRPSSPTRT